MIPVYEKYGSTCLSSIRLWNSQVYYWLADADALKSVTSDRQTFQKDIEAVSIPTMSFNKVYRFIELRSAVRATEYLWR